MDLTHGVGGLGVDRVDPAGPEARDLLPVLELGGRVGHLLVIVLLRVERLGAGHLARGRGRPSARRREVLALAQVVVVRAGIGDHGARVVERVATQTEVNCLRLHPVGRGDERVVHLRPGLAADLGLDRRGVRAQHLLDEVQRLGTRFPLARALVDGGLESGE
jgi:hypothetical protein